MNPNTPLRRAARRAFGNAYLLLTFMALFWAGNQVLGRAVTGHVPPILFSFLRWALAAIIILPAAWPYLRRDWPVLRANWMLLAFLGIIGGGIFNTLQYIGLNYTTALNGLVLNSTGPIFIAIACFFIFGDRLTPIQMLGTVLSFTGVMVVIADGNFEALLNLTLNRGDLILLVAMASTGLYTAYLRKRPNIHWLSFLAAQFVAAALFNVPLVIAEAAMGARPELTLFSFLAIAYVAIFPSIVSYFCFIRGVELIGGVRAGIFIHLIPLFGALLAVGLLGEPLLTSNVIGFILIIAGVALTSRKPSD